MDELIVICASNVRMFRKQKRLSQKKLGEKSQINPSYVCAIEKGKINVSAYTLKRLAKGLEVEPHELLISHFDDGKWNATFLFDKSKWLK